MSDRRHLLRRIGRDLEQRRHVEAYVVAGVAVVLAVLSLVGDVVTDGIRWAVVLAALSLLTYQITAPAKAVDVDDVLHSRTSFDDVTLGSRLKGRTCVWIFGPSAISLLTADTANHLRTLILGQPGGVVRVMILDPAAPDAVNLAARQLDDSTDYASNELRPALETVVDRVERMATWDISGRFEYGFAPFSPGFSLLALDPYGKDGLLIVEFHGVHNESTASRMHVELTRAASERWFVYWRDQFEHLWDLARRPTG